MTFRSILFLLAGLSVAGGGVYVFRSLDDDPAPPPATWRAPNLVATRTERGPMFRGGLRRTYDFEVAAQITGEQFQPAKITIAGQLALDVVDQADVRSRVRVQLAVSKATSTTGDQQLPVGIDKPFYVDYDDHGLPSRAYFDRDLPRDARTIAKGVLGAMTADLRDGDTWLTTEQDRTGFYEAAYTRDHGTIHKHKTRYDRVWIGADLLPNTELADCDGEIAMTVDDERWPVDTTGSVWVRMKAGKEAASSTTVTETSRFHLASELPDATGIGSFERDADHLVAGDFFGPDRDPNAQQQSDALVSKGLSVASLLGDLRMAGDSGNRGVAQLKMSALFRAHPTTIADATAAIRGGQLSKEDAQAVLGSLRDAATPMAIDAVASVLGTAGVDAETRSAAAASLSLAKTTTPAAIASLRDGATDPDSSVRSSSILALGGVVPQAGDGGSAITGDLLGSLDRATSAEDRALYIRALGNAGQASAYPAIVAALDDPSPLVQTAAVAALRFIEVADVDPLLDRIATTNDDGDVRESAVFAIGFRTLAIHNTALGQVARSDAADTARLAAIDLLGREVKSDPAVRALLQTCAAQDPSADVRARAATAVGS